MITCFVLRVPLLAAEIDRARPHLTAQLREGFFQAKAAETVGNPSPQPFSWTAAFFVCGCSKNIPHLFFHAAAMALRPLSQARFYVFFDVAYDELGHIDLQ
jgi:hypothetical protein